MDRLFMNISPPPTPYPSSETMNFVGLECRIRLTELKPLDSHTCRVPAPLSMSCVLMGSPKGPKTVAYMVSPRTGRPLCVASPMICMVVGQTLGLFIRLPVNCTGTSLAFPGLDNTSSEILWRMPVLMALYFHLPDC